MTPGAIKQKILKYNWEPWMQRPFFGFLISLFNNGLSKKDFAKIRLPKAQYTALVFNHGYWYKSHEVHDKIKPALDEYLKRHRVIKIVKELQNYYSEQKPKVFALNNSRQSPEARLKILYRIITPIITYVWLTHALEDLLNDRLQKQAPKFVKVDVEKFITAASFPMQKSAQALMEEDLRRGQDLKIVARQFGWMRARDGFSRPFSAAEFVEMKKNLKPVGRSPKIRVPRPLARLVNDVQSLVYLRTLRTDILYKFLFLARPTLKDAAKKFAIPFSELKYFSIQSLIAGKPERYPAKFTYLNFLNHPSIFKENLFPSGRFNNQKNLSGMVAFAGKAIGRAKIVNNVRQINKVGKNDILITHMTNPNFLPAMQAAKAFVTDEGGLTCHAAIVAREMKKPCVIGTKIATKIFKDGDVVEVDANKGIVKKL